MVDAPLQAPDRAPIRADKTFEARLDGEKISFVLVEDDTSYRFEGVVRGDVMEGVVRYGYGPKASEQRWRALRVSTVP